MKIELDHIIPQSEPASNDDISNAIPVCFECHAEIHSYNDKHPRGRKFRTEELRKHKEQWLELCRENPGAILAKAPHDSSVGPLQALIDELDFNEIAATHISGYGACLFLIDQFERAVREGAISMLQEELKRVILEAYTAMSKANLQISGAMAHMHGTEGRGRDLGDAINQIKEVETTIKKARQALLDFLGSEK